MKEKEAVRTQVGIFNLPGNMAFPNDKVLQIFTKLKRRADAMETKSPSPAASGPADGGTPIQDLEPNLEELRHSAMNSYRIGPEVVKTENGFEVVGRLQPKL